MKTMWLYVPDSGERPVVIAVGAAPKGPGQVFEVQARDAPNCKSLVARYLTLEAGGLPEEPRALELLAIPEPSLAQVKRVARYSLVVVEEEIRVPAKMKTITRPVTRLVREEDKNGRS